MDSPTWNVFGGLAFTDSGGSDVYEDAFSHAMEALRRDFSQVGRAWFDEQRFGDLTLIVTFRRTIPRAQTRVTMTSEYVQSTRTVPTESYFGLSRDQMLADACAHVVASLEAVARKVGLPEPPITVSGLLARASDPEAPR